MKDEIHSYDNESKIIIYVRNLKPKIKINELTKLINVLGILIIKTLIKKINLKHSYKCFEEEYINYCNEDWKLNKLINKMCKIFNDKQNEKDQLQKIYYEIEILS